MPRISVKKNEQQPESKEVLAEAIIRIGEAFSALQKNGLNKRAIEVLVHAETKVAMRDIRLILDALPRLRGWYCR